MRSKIEELLNKYYSRYTVIERFPGTVEFYLPGKAVLFDFAIQLEVLKAAGCEFNVYHLPWWKNWFNRKIWIIGLPLPPKHFNCRCEMILIEEINGN